MQHDMKKEKTILASENLFKVNKDSPILLSEKDRVLVHSSRTRLLFLKKRARPDVQTPVTFLCTKVKMLDEDNYMKNKRATGYLYQILYAPLILGTNKSDNIYWWKEGAHAVHQDMNGHTGLVMSFGHGAALSVPLKQKFNIMSSTETKTVALTDGMPKNMCVY